MTEREALKLALEALEKLNNTNSYWWQEVDEEIVEKIKPAITAINKALAQPEQEPDKYMMDIECTKCGAKQSGILTVNTTPPQRTWVGLTNNDLQPIAEEYRILFGSWVHDFARAIEAKLKEKNTRQDGDCKYCTHGCPACDARRQSNVLP